MMTITCTAPVQFTLDEPVKLYPLYYLKVNGTRVTAHSAITGNELILNERGYWKVTPKRIKELKENRKLIIR